MPGAQPGPAGNGMLSKTLDKIFLALCGLALLVRLVLEPSLTVFEALGQEKVAALASNANVFALSFLYILKKAALREPVLFPRTLWPLAAFGLAGGISILYSVDAPSSVLASSDLWAAFFFVLVLADLLGRNAGAIEAFCGMLVALMAVAAAEAAYEYLVLLPQVVVQNSGGAPATRTLLQLVHSHRTPTLLGWPNVLAGFLAMTVPLAAAGLAPARRPATRALNAAAALLALYAMFLTMTVSAWLGLGAAAATLYLALKGRPLSRREKTAWLAAALLLAAVIAFTAFRKMTLPGVSSADARQQYLHSALSLIRLHPFLGSGLRSYGIANTPYIRDIHGRSAYAHNSYLQIWAELGAAGLAVLLWFLWSLWHDARAVMHERHRGQRWLAGGIIAAIAAGLVDNLFSYTMLRPQVSLFWWVLCALLIALRQRLEPENGGPKSQAAWKILFTAMTLAGLIMSVRLAQAEAWYSTAVSYINSGTRHEAAERLVRQAKSLNPWDKKYDLARAYALYGMFFRDRDPRTLELARSAALASNGQMSLGAERENIIRKIDAARAAAERPRREIRMRLRPGEGP